MPDRFIESHISRIPLFAKFSPPQLELIGLTFEARRYERGEWLFRQGEAAQGLYIILSGSGVMTQVGPDGIERQVALVQPNQYIGQEALLKDSLESASVFFQETSSLLFLSRARLLTLLTHHPELKPGFGIAPEALPQQKQPKQFKTQRDNEEVRLITRRHWWAFIRLAWVPLFLMVAMWLLALLSQTPAISISLGVLSLLFPGVLTGYAYLEWRNDSVIITDQRVIQLQRNILQFSENVREVQLDNINEVNVDIPGSDLFAQLWGYGHIELKSAGQAANIKLEMVPNPKNLGKLILEDRERFKQRQAQQHRNTLRADLDRWLTGDPSPAAPKGDPKKMDSSGLPFLQTRKVMPNGDVIYRKHVIVWIRHGFVPILVILGGLALFGLSAIVPFLQGLGIISLAIAMLVLLIGAVWLYLVDWDWRNDYYIVTDSTITVIHQRPLWLQNERDQILLSQVDNVVAEVKGLSAQLFKIGDVRISLIGSNQPKVFYSVADPLEVQADISRRQQHLKQQQAQAAQQQQRQLIGEYLSLYNERVGPNLPTQPVQPAAQAGPPPPPPPDRSRPPSVPQQRMPYISPGKPYAPPDYGGDRPPNIPRSRPRE